MNLIVDGIKTYPNQVKLKVKPFILQNKFKIITIDRDEYNRLCNKMGYDIQDTWINYDRYTNSIVPILDGFLEVFYIIDNVVYLFLRKKDNLMTIVQTDYNNFKKLNIITGINIYYDIEKEKVIKIHNKGIRE